MNDFDQAARYTVRLDPPGFLQWLLPSLPAGVVFRRWLDTRTVPFPGEADRICDTVAEIVDPADPDASAALVIEFESEPDPDMLDRLLEYVARLRRELRCGPRRRQKYKALSALLNLTGKVQSGALDMELPGGADVGLRFRVVVRTMGQEDAAATLNQIAAGKISRCMLPWIPLMRGAGKGGIIEQWKLVASQEDDRRLRTTYAGLAVVFANLPGRGRLWREGLEGWNMGESPFMNEIRAEGEVKARREDLLRVLRLRFPKKLPTDIVTAIKSQSDAAKLTAWLVAAVTAATPEEFRAALGR